ncbi:MAG: NlpC/P60 family protein [Terriglobia bacterium]
MVFLLALTLMAPAEFGAVVVEPVANMYSGPSQDTDVVSQAILGEGVVLVEEKGAWTKVRTADDYSGWMLLEALRRYGADDHAYASTGTVAQVENPFANVYREPSVTKHQPVLTLPFTARLEVTAEPKNNDGRWLEVSLPDGRTAWIQRGDVNMSPSPLSIKETINLAKRFLGFTYLWGGTSSFGFDCSGFTQMLVRSRGIVMPRDADLQAAWTGVEAVKRNKLRAGDLLFFGSSPQRITHTGMYIGRGKFIHDTTHEHPGVQISRLAHQPWTHLLVACRRVK